MANCKNGKAMATAKQIPHVSGLLFQHQAILEELSTDELQQAGQRPGEFMKCAVMAWKLQLQQSAKKVVTSFLKIVKSGISVPSFSAVKTADCFKKGFAYRDSDIDNWMTKDTTVSNAGLVTCYELTEDGRTFLDMARSILETEETHEKEIARLLVARDKSFTLKQVEDLHKRFIAGETEIGFNTNGYANLFFVHDEKSVFVLLVYLLSGGWRVYVRKLGSSDRWGREHRLFSRN